MKSNYILLAMLVLLGSCQSQTKEKETLNKSNSYNNEYDGEWFFVKKDAKNEYIYCDDIPKSLVINKNSIKDHTPMEDSDFKVDHIKEKNGVIFFYLEKNESSFYKFEWIDKNKGISKWTLGSYEGDFYINKTGLKNVKKGNCNQETENPKCELSNLSIKFNFIVSGLEFENEKDKKRPVSVLLTIVDKLNSSKTQEIRFEPRSWVLFDDIPCKSFVVKDFNFDKLEDFAFIWDDGGNSGPIFSYYFQNKKGEFIEDSNFPLNHGFFPKEINPKDRTLMISGVFGCCKKYKTIYQLKEDGKWVVIHSEEKEK